jgi:anti-anti-sigma regulatory factor
MLDLMEMLEGFAEEVEVPSLPLPEVVDTAAVVLAGMLAGGTRPLVLDASRVRQVQGTAAPLLAALLRAKREAGVEARISGASAELRHRWARHALAVYFGEANPGPDALFTCPDRDELGFSPSLR